MTDSASNVTDLESRLAAQRLVLEWLLEAVVTDRETLGRLTSAIEAKFPPQDGQEDPGAVTTAAFGDMAATTAELRLLLDPLKAKFGALDD